MKTRLPARGAGSLLLAVAVLAAAAGTATAGQKAAPYDEKEALALSQAAIGRQVLGRPDVDYRFVDSSGRTVRLDSFLGKPLVVNFVYTACVTFCPGTVQTLRDAAEVTEDSIGPGKFNIVTIGFDTRSDTPDRMRAFARTQGVDRPNWYFLSGDRRTVEELARDLGFLYFASAKGFDHLAQTTLLDGDGRVYRQIYGTNFEARDLGDPLRDLVLGSNLSVATVEGFLNRVRLFCTYYDPSLGRYRIDYSIFIGAFIGFAALSGVGFILVRAILRQHKLQRNA